MSPRRPVVVVTGASKGIGLAVTRFLLDKFNANVVALSRTRTPELDQLSSENLLIIQCDITNEAALSDAIAQAEAKYTHIDGLILNAAILGPMCRIGDGTPLSAWKAHFDVNFFSLISALTSALPALRRSELGGRVIFVSSVAGVHGLPGWGPYNTGKAAMNSLCRTLSEEEPNITSITLDPGRNDTGMQAYIREVGESYMDEKAHAFFVEEHTTGRLGRPEDCGHVIAALSVKGTKNLSGKFVAWDSEDCKEFRRL